MAESERSSTGAEVLVRTFLIADVRGYTSFTVEHGDRAAARLATKFATIAREGVAARDGQVIELRGDEALAVFTSPQQALRAAVELQRRFRLESEAEPGLPLKVGIGVDAGEAIPVEGGYRGLALNLAARLCSLAGPGEVYGTEGIVQRAQRLEGLAYVERGRVPLKGFADPVRVVQVLPDDELPASFPPLKTLIAKPSNLPLQSTPFVGREREVGELVELLKRDDVRLLTLTGPGGTGKTRLALQAAAAVLDDFERGVFLVPLAPLGDSSLVASEIATTLNVKEAAGETLLNTLEEYLRDRQMLLVLDNFEHVLDGASVVSQLLSTCPRLKVLATSRSVLHLSSEFDYAVPPLAVPDLRHLPPLEELQRFDAVALFAGRAAAAKTDFALDESNSRAVAEICAAVDGLPLAIELAAARVKVFPPPILLNRLTRRLNLLTGGARDLPTRQQTLRAAIDWSYSLLEPEEQLLFGRLAVFAGGCTTGAAETVCEQTDAVFEELQSLVDKSLLRREGDEDPRFDMLQTIREYALQRLEGSGEGTRFRLRHAEFYMALAEEARPGFRAPDQEVWLRRLEAEHDNLRAALGWTLEEGESDVALRLSSALHWFWQVHGYLSEGRRWLEQSLAQAGGASSPVQVEVLNGAGWLALYQNDLQGAENFLGRAVELARGLGDEEGVAEALYALGHLATVRGEYDEARAVYEESLDISLGLNDTWGIMRVTNDLGALALNLGAYDRAVELLEEGLALARHLHQRRAVAILLFNLAYAAWSAGERERARGLYEESLAGFRDVGDKLGTAMSLGELAMAAAFGGESPGDLLAESLELYGELDYPLGMAAWLENCARIAAFRGESERAARLHGAAHAIRTSIGVPLSPSDAGVHERDLLAARTQLGESWSALWEAGAAMTAEQAVEYGLGLDR